MRLQDDLPDARWMYLKAVLFLVAGVISLLALLLQNPTWQTAFLLGIVIWAFCRLYYFMFYRTKGKKTSVACPFTLA